MESKDKKQLSEQDAFILREWLKHSRSKHLMDHLKEEHDLAVTTAQNLSLKDNSSDNAIRKANIKAAIIKEIIDYVTT